LGVSKTPVREALSKLAHDGIVEIVPNRGAYKVRLSKEDLQEIMVIMETLEGLCVRLAVANIDETIIKRLKSILDNFEEKDLENDFSWYSDALIKFYTVIYNASKNKRLIRVIQGMYDLTHVFRSLYFMVLPAFVWVHYPS
jgi:DNA-binding GntR family transcriptional regulator